MFNSVRFGGSTIRKLCTLTFLFFSCRQWPIMAQARPAAARLPRAAETMKQGGAEVTFRLDYTQFEDITNSEAARLARKGGEFDALNDSLVANIEVAYGITNDFQISGQIGYYWGSGFVSAASENGTDVELATADPEGLTDLWITGNIASSKVRRGIYQ